MKNFFKRSGLYLGGVVATSLSFIGVNSANAQSFDLTPNATTTAAVVPINTLIGDYAGQALAFVIAIFGEMWYWFLLIGAVFFVIRWLRNTGGHK